MLDIILKMLTAYMAASRAYLSAFLRRTPNVSNRRTTSATAAAASENGNSTAANPLPTDQEREELKSALMATQDSAVVQILLEICLPFENEDRSRKRRMGGQGEPGEPGENQGESKLSVLREVQCQVCSLLHQMFIADPHLAKLVHFHGYSSELLPVTVAGIPSMHICLDFIPELLSQPQQDKQVRQH